MIGQARFGFGEGRLHGPSADGRQALATFLPEREPAPKMGHACFAIEALTGSRDGPGRSIKADRELKRDAVPCGEASFAGAL